MKRVAKPLERQRAVAFDKMLEHVASGSTDEDLVSSLAGRLAVLERKLTQEDQQAVIQASGGFKRLSSGKISSNPAKVLTRMIAVTSISA